MKKLATSWTAWVGFVDDKPHASKSTDAYCYGEEQVVTLEVFAKKADAKKRFTDFRRVRITLEPKP